MQPFQDPQVDADHDWMITFFDRLRMSPGGPTEDPRVFRQLAACLLDYLSGHCQREEQLMRDRGYEETDGHAEAHRQLQREFQRLLMPRLEGHLDLEEDLRLVRELFLCHIVTWDDAFGAWLARHPGRSTTSGRDGP